MSQRPTCIVSIWLRKSGPLKPTKSTGATGRNEIVLIVMKQAKLSADHREPIPIPGRCELKEVKTNYSGCST